MSTTDYPEHAKLENNGDLRAALAEFTAWLSDQGVHLVRYGNAGRDRPVTVIDGLVAKFLGVDEAKLEIERRAMLAALHQANLEPIPAQCA